MSRREYFYAPPENFSAHTVTLTGDEHRHLVTVLRHKAGDRVTVVDGAGIAAIDSEIVAVGRTATHLKIHKRVRHRGEPFVHITLAPAIPKGSRFDWLVEKATEIGVSAFVPLLCKRGEVLAGAGKIERWRHLAKAAMKQSCRSVWPAVSAPLRFADLCEKARGYNLALLAHENGGDPLQERSQDLPPRQVLLVIGPEGGFDESELALARESGFAFLGMGPRRLRSDTAAVVAVVKVLSALGQLN